MKISIPCKNIDVEGILDQLMNCPVVIIDNEQLVRKLGMCVAPLRNNNKKSIMHISTDRKLNETAIVIKDWKKGTITKSKAKTIVYEFL